MRKEIKENHAKAVEAYKHCAELLRVNPLSTAAGYPQIAAYRMARQALNCAASSAQEALLATVSAAEKSLKEAPDYTAELSTSIGCAAMAEQYESLCFMLVEEMMLCTNMTY